VVRRPACCVLSGLQQYHWITIHFTLLFANYATGARSPTVLPSHLIHIFFVISVVHLLVSLSLSPPLSLSLYQWMCLSSQKVEIVHPSLSLSFVFSAFFLRQDSSELCAFLFPMLLSLSSRSLAEHSLFEPFNALVSSLLAKKIFSATHWYEISLTSEELIYQILFMGVPHLVPSRSGIIHPIQSWAADTCLIFCEKQRNCGRGLNRIFCFEITFCEACLRFSASSAARNMVTANPAC
jgi:hypothetical protein